MFSWPYVSIPYLWPFLAILLFVCSPMYLCFNITYHQTCWPLEGLWHIFLQYIHVLALHGPNGWKIIIDQIIAKKLKRVLACLSSHYSNYPWSFFFFKGNLLAHDVMAILLYFWFIYTLVSFYKSKRCMC